MSQLPDTIPGARQPLFSVGPKPFSFGPKIVRQRIRLVEVLRQFRANEIAEVNFKKQRSHQDLKPNFLPFSQRIRTRIALTLVRLACWVTGSETNFVGDIEPTPLITGTHMLHRGIYTYIPD